MKIKFEYNGEIIDVDRIYISVDDIEYKITEAAPAYKDDGNLRIIKSALNSSSTIKICPSVTNDILIK